MKTYWIFINCYYWKIWYTSYIMNISIGLSTIVKKGEENGKNTRMEVFCSVVVQYSNWEYEIVVFIVDWKFKLLFQLLPLLESFQLIPVVLFGYWLYLGSLIYRIAFRVSLVYTYNYVVLYDQSRILYCDIFFTGIKKRKYVIETETNFFKIGNGNKKKQLVPTFMTPSDISHIKFKVRY